MREAIGSPETVECRKIISTCMQSSNNQKKGATLNLMLSCSFLVYHKNEEKHETTTEVLPSTAGGYFI
jgi:hypothetical protein